MISTDMSYESRYQNASLHGPIVDRIGVTASDALARKAAAQRRYKIAVSASGVIGLVVGATIAFFRSKGE